jgi:hypothetical protein
MNVRGHFRNFFGFCLLGLFGEGRIDSEVREHRR